MFVIALASFVVGYAIVYYAVDAMSHYDSATKTTKGIPLASAFGIPGGSAANTAMVFAAWGGSGKSLTTGPAATSPSGSTGGTVSI